MRKSFLEFKKFLDGIDVKNKSQRRNQTYAGKAVKSGAVMFGEFKGYEAWYVPSYQASVQLGRFYGGSSTNWCISTDNPKYFENDYAGITFIFLINQNLPAENALRKLAIEVDEYERSPIMIWNSDNEELYDSGMDIDESILSVCNSAIDFFCDNAESIRDKSDRSGYHQRAKRA